MAVYSRTPHPSNLPRALAIRDAVLPWLREHGYLAAVGRGEHISLLFGTIAGFSFEYQDRFGGRPQLLQALPYVLSVRGEKCWLIVEWDDRGQARLLRFQGIRNQPEWDRLLSAIARG